MNQFPVISALQFYLCATFINRIKCTAKAIKSPRNLAVVTLVIALMALLPMFPRKYFEHAFIEMSKLVLDCKYLIFLFIVFEICLKFMVTARRINSLGRLLKFDRSDIEFFFASPISRNQVVLFKYLTLQGYMLLATIFSSIVLSVVFDHFELLKLFVSIQLVGQFLLILYLAIVYGLGYCALNRITALSRCLIGSLMAAVLFQIWQAVNYSTVNFNNILQFQNAPAFEMIKWSFDSLFAPAMSSSWTELWQAGYGFLALWLCMFLIFFTRRFDVAYFDNKVTDGNLPNKSRLSANKKKLTIFSQKGSANLAAEGPQWLAIVWKSVRAGTVEHKNLYSLVLMAMLFTLLMLFVVKLPTGAQYAVSVLGNTIIIGTVVICPWVIRGGFRADMLYFDLLKAMPVKGTHLLFGSLFVQVALAFSAILFACAAIYLAVDESTGNPKESITILPLLFGLIVARFTVYNLFALYLPYFVKFKPQSGSEIQEFLFGGVVSFAVWLVLLIVPVGIGIAIYSYGIFFSNLASPNYSALAVNCAGVVLVMECLAFIRLSESRYQNFDISAENVSR